MSSGTKMETGLTVRELRSLPFWANVRWQGPNHDFVVTKVSVERDEWQGKFSLVRSEQLAGAELISMPMPADADQLATLLRMTALRDLPEREQNALRRVARFLRGEECDT